MSFEYVASHTLKHFHKSDAFVRGAMGPIGSGKSVACCMEIFTKACQQEKWVDKQHPLGIRRSRWAVIRNTYRELEDTTMQTWFDWFPKHLGHFRAMDAKFTLCFPHPDEDDDSEVYLEVIFRALDRPNDVKKLLSLELTGAWINEAREIPKAILDMLQGRVGRYPSKRDGGPSWWGVIMDTNPPDEDHWWYKTFEEDIPEEWACFKQPSGIGPEAENISNLPKHYYKRMMPGKDQEWINVYVHGRYGFVSDGKPVLPEYKDDIHQTSENLTPLGEAILYVGIDFGLTPAAVIGQKLPSGQLQIIDELVTEDMGAVNFGRLLHERLSTEYKDHSFEIYADPAGEQRSQTDEMTPFQILWNQNLEAIPTYTNDFTIRREAVADLMQRLDFRGQPAFLLGPKAKMLRKALAGGYKYRRMQVVGQERYQNIPDKNRYSHVADALQYLVLGAIGGDRVVGGMSTGQSLDYSSINQVIV